MNWSPGISSNVLIVDDESHNRQLLEVMLRSEGYLIHSASSGEQALRMIEEKCPDLILLDIMMPGMDGYEVTRRLKGDPNTKSVPVILVTALDHREARMLGLGAGAEDFLSKPVDRAELCARVRNLLRLKAYADHYDSYSQILEREVSSQGAALATSEKLYRSTFEGAPVGIVHVGMDYRWLSVNQLVCDLFGYTSAEFRDIDATALLHAPQEPDEREALDALVEGTLERYTVAEKRYTHRDGHHLWARLNISLHRNSVGEPKHFIAVIEDITERRALETELRQSNKMDAIGRLASGVAHDFNNLLTVILGCSEFLSADPALREHAKDLGEISGAARRATELTKQLLAFSRQQVLRAVPVDLNAVVTETTGMLGRLIGEHVTFSLILAPRLSLALADRGQLEQVIMNLVVNARDAMVGGGCVTIETSDVDFSVTPAGELDERYVMLTVTDTGCGMSAETQRRLFEPFYTTKATGHGTGLGLSTTYGIVKQSKGHLTVQSAPGEGTEFKVYLPVCQGGAPASEASEAGMPRQEDRKGHETILLVEDEPGVRKLAKRILDRAGYIILEAADGKEAETLFFESPGSVDLVVTDVMMPGRGGPALLERLKASEPGLRVLFISGYSELTVAQKAGITGEVPFLQKPFTAAELLEQVRSALDAPPSIG